MKMNISFTLFMVWGSTTKRGVHGLILPRKPCSFPPVLLVVSGGAAAIPALPVPATAAFLPAAATSVFAPAAMLVTSSGRSAATPLLVPLPLSLCEVRKNTGWQTRQSSGASFLSDKTKCFQTVPTPLYFRYTPNDFTRPPHLRLAWFPGNKTKLTSLVSQEFAWNIGKLQETQSST